MILSDKLRRFTKMTSVAYCVVCYIFAAAVAAVVVAWPVSENPVVAAAAADLLATVMVFGFSRLANNSSVYDPYWSIAPLALLVFWLDLGPQAGPRAWVVLTLVFWWSVRLTGNWVRRWRGLKEEDWRYRDLRVRHGRTYWLVSLFGIHLLPTTLVFLGCLPLYQLTMSTYLQLGLLDGLAAIVTVVAILIETIADRQLYRFLQRYPKTDTTLSSGLWAWSRHPNYFGEILFWVGLFLFGLAADPRNWWTGIGALAVILLFAFVSVPMIDKRMLARRQDYSQIMRTRSAIIPWRRWNR